MTKKKPKSEHKERGRPTVVTPSVIAKLEECFAKGYNDYEAYNSAGISRDAFYDYRKANPDFGDKVEWLKNNTRILAKEVVYDKLLDRDLLTAKWLLERKAKDEFSLRTEQTGKDGEAIEVKNKIEIEFVNGGEENQNQDS